MLPSTSRHITIGLIFFVVFGCSQSDPPVPVDVGDAASQDRSGSNVPREEESGTPQSVPKDNEANTLASPAEDDGTVPNVEPENPFRIVDDLPSLNTKRLSAAGIHMIESARLVLLTDRDPDTVRDLPPLADEFYEFLEQQCGPLRPERFGSEFRAVGCLMVDQERFETAGLVPDRVVDMMHGQQLGYRFWIRDQNEDYYRRHLLLHEFAHVYMTCDNGLSDVPPAWFMEGAAEVFATHTLTDGTPSFGVIPMQLAGMEDWGRISTIRRSRIEGASTDVRSQSLPTIEDVRFPQGQRALDEARYAWWWAQAWMLRHNSEYSRTWDSLCHSRGLKAFHELATQLDHSHGNRLTVDWLLFADSVTEGFDFTLSFPQHLDVAEPPRERMAVSAASGWQDTGWMLQTGDRVKVTSTGECVLNQTTAPWVSRPNGITLEYSQGRPIGEALAVLVSGDDGWISQRISVGYDTTITATRASRLWLMINDDARARDNNSGVYDVQIRMVSPPSVP